MKGSVTLQGSLLAVRREASRWHTDNAEERDLLEGEREIVYAIALLRLTFPIPFFFLRTPAFKIEAILLSVPIIIHFKLFENH